MVDWRSTLKRRLIVVAVVFLAWSGAIEARLVYLQVVQHDELKARADTQQRRTIETSAKRGEIVDRGGRVLAHSVDADSIYAVPAELEDAAAAAAALCGALGDCTRREQQTLLERFNRGGPFAYVRRTATPEQARRVAELNLPGVGFMKEDRRFYPNKELAAHVLGFVGVDNVGLSGIEATYDTLIKGRPGRVLVETDARRHAFSRVEEPPTAGASLELSLDHYLQYIAERELKWGVDRAGASGGSALVMNPETGEILALANYPTFNPNLYSGFGADRRRNRAVQDLYEPGSTFKIVTAGAGIEEDVVRPDTIIDASAGLIRFGGRVINDDHNYGVLSFADVIVQSSNVGAIKVALQLGPQRVSDYVRRFGFGRRSSPDFPGENPGIVWDPARLNDSALASVAMGYQVAVTPLQVAAAVSAVANGGQLIEPRVVRAVIRDGVRSPVPRKVLGRAINAETAATLVDIMEAVVQRGTGINAQVPGFMVAGKTGTAKKLVNGSYQGHDDYNVSFAGFVPSRQPAFSIVVVIDSPRRLPAYGSQVAAPVFQRIASEALRHYAIPPTHAGAPPLLVARRDESRLEPAPAVAELTPAVAAVSATTGTTTSGFPDVRGMSARDAVRTLTQIGVTPRLRGTGVVVGQTPLPGSSIERGAIATLQLDRHAAEQRGTVDASGGPGPADAAQ
jgi:cell division protein FtsI (penicillin-binding protein 3)